MSHRRLPRARGTVIMCDGCGLESFTGQVVIAYHRAWLLRDCGWARGALRATKHHSGTTGNDLCPACGAHDRASMERRRKRKIAAVRAVRQRKGATP